MWELFLEGKWTVFILNFPSNLLILRDIDSWNGKEATPTGLVFSVVLLCSLLMALLKLRHYTNSV
jgi:hypothetical protein